MDDLPKKRGLSQFSVASWKNVSPSHEEKKEVVFYTHFEEVLARIQPFGPYQIFCCVVILYASIEWAGNATFMDTLGSVEPDWNCTLPDNSSIIIQSTDANKCQILDNECTKFIGHKADDLEFYSLRAHFGLICKKDRTKHIQVIMAAGSLIGSLVGGHLGDYLGRQTIFFAGQLLILITSMFATAAQDWISFSIIMLVNCLLYGVLETTTLVMMMEYTSNKFRLISTACFQWPLAYMVIALIAYLTKHWQNYFVFLNLVASPLVIFFMLFHESPRWLVARNKLDEACDVLNDIAHERWNNTKARFTTRDLSSIHKTHERSQPFYNLTHLFRSKRLAKQTLMQILSVFTYSIVSATYLYTTSGIHNGAIIFTLLDGVFRLPTPLIIIFLDIQFKMFGRKSQFILALLIEALLFAAVIVLIALNYSYGHISVTILIIVATMINDCIFWMNIVQITTQRYPTVIRCIAFGTIHCIKHLGTIVGVLLLQQLLIDRPIVAFIIPEALILITLVIGIIIQPETKGKALMDQMVEANYGRLENALPRALIRLAAGHKVAQMEIRQELKEEMARHQAAAQNGGVVNSPWLFKGGDDDEDQCDFGSMRDLRSDPHELAATRLVEELHYEQPPPPPAHSITIHAPSSEDSFDTEGAHDNYGYEGEREDRTEQYKRQFEKEKDTAYHSHDGERSRMNSHVVEGTEEEDSLRL